MEKSYCSQRIEIENFLKTLKEILINQNFDINRDFDIL